MNLFIVAGESSGDLHGKNLLRELKKKDPNLKSFGLGGDGLANEGMTVVKHIRDSDFMGFVEVVKNLGKIRRLFRELKAAVMKEKPDAAILIDFPGFNLRLAPFLKQQGIPVIYYISPQVWAWKKSRVKKIKRYVDLMGVVLPFEKNFYKQEGMEVDFVGHPLLDEINADAVDKAALRKSLGLDDRPVLALLPGSRRQEIKKTLKVMLQAAGEMKNYQVVIAGAKMQPKTLYEQILCGRDAKVLMNKTYDVLRVANVAAVASGTATLETGLFGVPQVVCFSANWLSVQIARMLIKVKYISIVNLVLDRPLVKELIQSQFTAANLLQELKNLTEQEEDKIRIKEGYSELREKLGSSGASARMAELVYAHLQEVSTE